MLLHELRQGLGLELVCGSDSLDIKNLTDDSRAVTPVSLFIARQGAQSSGASYIKDAIAKGAAAVVAEQAPDPSLYHVQPGESPVAWMTAKKVGQGLAGKLAERFYGSPSTRLKLIGITGTNGKTTTAFLIRHFMEQAGVGCGLIGTILVHDGKTAEPASLTTPGAIEFSRLLRAMVDNGCRAAVAEFSSHALHQGRTAALRTDVAVFTNLTGDHLDYHKTMERYADAKAMLFESLTPASVAVINIDDPFAERMVKSCQGKIVRCSVNTGNESNSDYQAAVLHLAADHTEVRFRGPWGEFDARVPSIGRHNVINLLEAMAATFCLCDWSLEALREAVERCPAVPGRLEPVRTGVSSGSPSQGSSGKSDQIASEGGTPVVLVDYAHTHDALENVLRALRPLTKGKLIVVFGCGGDRDKTKRPKMAETACRLTDLVVVTSDNPRTEDPGQIINQILAGVPKGVEIHHEKYTVKGAGQSADKSRSATKAAGVMVFVQADRAQAIRQTVLAARSEDVILLAGKGHENYQIVGAVKQRFDDREHAAEALRHWAEQHLEARQVKNKAG